MLNIASEVRARGHEYSNDVIRCEAIEADDEVALRLGVRLGAEVFHTILVHRENGVPIQLEDRFVNPRWVPNYLKTDFSRQTPNEILVANCPISDVEHVVEAVLVDRHTANWLQIDTAAPCLSMIRRTWSDEHLISYARLIHPGDRYKLRSAQKRRRN
ncbi:histidine utilization repressor [compost metagenome]